jgi:hypothetical protein
MRLGSPPAECVSRRSAGMPNSLPRAREAFRQLSGPFRAGLAVFAQNNSMPNFKSVSPTPRHPGFTNYPSHLGNSEKSKPHLFGFSRQS